ncbi:MAG: putative ribosome recycling factor [Candidatus Peregrinibacteria bacterium Greene0416_19]|nr:MAG: putative ribosome recycling factor [Candidatus Peregrinibacteria bacterium Greene0416_19]
MHDPRIATFLTEVDRVVQHLHAEFSKLQTGRANASLVEHVEVDAYGARQPLRNIAGVTVSDARTIVIQAWDRSVLQNVEKALQQANLGTNPVNDGSAIRINLPPMTEERRSQLKKIVSQLAEEARIAVRKHRQVAQDHIRGEMDEDVRETLMETLQKGVDETNATIADSARRKEEEVMKV